MNESAKWVDAYIGLGSNLDSPIDHIMSAIREISVAEGIKEIAVSPLYSSRPVGPQDQPDYVNAVMHVKTYLQPNDLLRTCQNIENNHGRKRLVRWGARTLDLDILLYDARIIDSPELSVPHPELANRAFVLYPLADIAPAELEIPGKANLATLLANCPAEGLNQLPL